MESIPKEYYSTVDLTDHEYTKLTDVNISKFNDVPTYIETVEVSTTDDLVLQSNASNCESRTVKADEFSTNKLTENEVLVLAESSNGCEIPKSEQPIPIIQIKTSMQLGHRPTLKSDESKPMKQEEMDGGDDLGLLEESIMENVGMSDSDPIEVGVKEEVIGNEMKSGNKSKLPESISLITNEETLNHGVSNYQIDYSNIADFVISEPIVFYHYGNISFKCTKMNNRVFIKTFDCSTLGLGDKEAIAAIQNFINSNECIRRLAVVDKLDPSNIAEFISEDIKLTKLSNDNVRLVCTYPDGRTITKVFVGTELGIKDPATRKVIQGFIDSEEGRNWVMKGAVGRGSWVKIGEVSTGVDTKRFITNNVKFDVNQRFMYEKRYLEIVRDEDALPASTSSHANWGTAHRADDRFTLKVSAEKVAKTVVARFHLECASLTSKCKTKCGVPISDVTIINGKFSCCGLVKEVQICFNCLINNTSQWYKIENGSAICNSCYKYYQRRGVHRPYCRKSNRKERIHESHTKCDWKLKLELKGDNITKWIIYEHTNNTKDHNIKVPCQTRSTLTERDKWDKLRSLAKLTPKQILMSESHLRNKMPDIQNKTDLSTFKAIRTRAKVIDSRKKNSSITMKDGIPISTHWRGSRITVEKYFEHMIFLQKENKEESREYHLVICPADSIDNLSDLEIPVDGYMEQARFKNGIIVVYYDSYEDVAAAFLISCMEEGLGLAISHELTFKIMDTDDHWSSMLQHEKHVEYKYNFKPTSDMSSKYGSVGTSKKYLGTPNVGFNFSNIGDLISEKPRVVKVSDVRVRLQCVIPEGKLLTKVFPSSNLGVQDPETYKVIQDFLDSKDCRQWIERKAAETWVKIGEVSTGVDTEQYLYHTINFEVMQRFFYRKKVLNIMYDGSTMLSVLSKPEGSSKSKSGSRPGIHKVGNKFSLKAPPEELGNKVVATMYIDCASTSEHCKTKCGYLAKEVSVVEGLFSCCGLPKEQIYLCFNCYTDNSDRWSKIAEDSYLCHTCYNYYKRKNHHRPSCMSKTKRKKIHESHVKCEWKMKLELRASDVTRWQVFKYYLNKDAHELNATKNSSSSSKRRVEESAKERPPKRMKLFGGKESDFSTDASTKIIKAFPRYAAGSGTSHQYDYSERPDENGFLMYPEIKEYITGLVLQDITCPKEIRLFLSQYACENFLVVESRDSKWNQNTVKELRTLVKGFIYYVQSDISAYSKGHESKKLMICLGKGYPTLYFVKELESALEDTENEQTVVDESGENILTSSEDVHIKQGGFDNSTVELDEKNLYVKDSKTHCVLVLDSNKEKSKYIEKKSEVPLKIFVTTGVKDC